MATRAEVDAVKRREATERNHALAKSRGFQFLENTYTTCRQKCGWICPEGVEFWAKPNTIKQRGGGCRHCWLKRANKTYPVNGKPRGVKPRTADDLRALWGKHGFVFTGDAYLGNTEPHSGTCGRGHVFVSSPNRIQQGHGCKFCDADNRRENLADVQALAASKGGRLVSEEYVSNKKPLEWECGNLHRWRATRSVIKRGSWCPHCRLVYKTPEERKLAAGLRRRLNNALKLFLGDGYRPGLRIGSAVKDLGCTMEFFQQWIEGQWHNHPVHGKMTWKNRGRGPGTWQIDHKWGFAEANLLNREDLKRVLHYSNQQPLWHEDHVKKTIETVWALQRKKAA